MFENCSRVVRRLDLGVKRESPENHRRVTQESPKSHPRVTQEWSKEWPESGPRGDRELPKSGPRVARELPESGPRVAWEWPERGPRVAWEWPESHLRAKRNLFARESSGSIESHVSYVSIVVGIIILAPSLICCYSGRSQNFHICIYILISTKMQKKSNDAFFGVNRGSCNKSLQRAVHSNGLYNLQ
jgi:hypothetical protein